MFSFARDNGIHEMIRIRGTGTPPKRQSPSTPLLIRSPPSAQRGRVLRQLGVLKIRLLFRLPALEKSTGASPAATQRDIHLLFLWT